MAKRPRGTIVNRRHVARLEREKIQTNYITIGSIAIIGLVVILLIAGFINENIIKANQPVAIVNGVEITTRQFQARVRYERNNLVNQYFNTVQTAQAFGGDPQFLAFFQNSLNQIEIQLEPESLGRDVLNALIEEVIIRQKAAEMGIVVTEEEVQKRLEEFFNYYGGGPPPTPTTTPTTKPTSTLTALQMTLTAPTATPVLTPTAILTPTVELTPTLSVTSTASLPPTQTGDLPTPTATQPPPTPTPFTEEAFQAEYRETIDYLDDFINFTEADLRYLLESQLYREKLFEAITGDLSREQDQVWARHILVEDEETALQVLARLEAGEDFAALAAEYSIDTATAQNGGDLGWFSLGQMALDFERVAFNLQPGQISEPVFTTFGWHIIQSLGHELRPLNDFEYNQLRQEKFAEWLRVQRQLLDEQIEIKDYWADRVPTEPSVQPINLQALFGLPTPVLDATPLPTPNQ